ncbi:hypothetical protein GCM10017643_16500 [Ancylobacter dichloromethanicus]|uniref:Uncharacterized protein n=1 Tax=Ancylobacter dichloromethanicus TaxID=518825 RepID=A0A9W6J639_9HYPH|nr:hypothetical protein GCM10017643_16500 [Ancylobacter dichloromethanicus]
MLSPQPLPQNEEVLRANGDDERGREQEAGGEGHEDMCHAAFVERAADQVKLVFLSLMKPHFIQPGWPLACPRGT